jgi:ABC-type xylose transport system substrate-binding protein
VPVVACDKLLMNPDVAAFVACDAIAMAEEIAQAAVDVTPKGNYVLALGDKGTNVAVEQRTGYYKALQPCLDDGTADSGAQGSMPRRQGLDQLGRRRAARGN